MEGELDNPHTWIVFSAAGLLLLGILCLIIDWKRDRSAPPPCGLPAWTPGWIEVTLFLWFILTLPLLLQNALSAWLRRYNLPFIGDEESWLLVVSGYAFHLTLLLLVILGFRLYPDVFKLRLTVLSRSPLRIIGAGAFAFFAAVPLVTLTAFAWTSFLQLLTQLGLPLDVRPQEMVLTIGNLDDFLPLLLLILLAVLVAPITEEIVFRGLIYRYLKRCLPTVIAMALSSLLFALIHANLLSFLPLFLLGMLLCRAYERSDNIWVVIVFHACFNLNTTLFLLAGLDPASP